MLYQIPLTFSWEQLSLQAISQYFFPCRSSTQSCIKATVINMLFCSYCNSAGLLMFFHRSILISDQGCCGLARNILLLIGFDQASSNSIQYYSERQHYRLNLQSKKHHILPQPFQNISKHINIPTYEIRLLPFQYRDVIELNPPKKSTQQEDLNII